MGAIHLHGPSKPRTSLWESTVPPLTNKEEPVLAVLDTTTCILPHRACRCLLTGKKLSFDVYKVKATPIHLHLYTLTAYVEHHRNLQSPSAQLTVIY